MPLLTPDRRPRFPPRLKTLLSVWVISHACSAGDTFEPAGIGGESYNTRTDNKTRKTNIHWSNDQELFDMVSHYGASANRQGEWNLQTSAMESIQIGQYPKGGHYNWHIDGLGIEPVHAPDNEFLHGKVRKISFVLWLNDDFEGGEFGRTSG